jgi:cytochrome c oxidase subunit 2
MLAPAGPHADSIATLLWVNVVLLGAVWIAVLVAVLLALRTHRQDERSRRRQLIAVGAATAATALMLFALLVASLWTGRAVERTPPHDAPLTVRIKASQWWWEVQYDDPVPARQVTTANEIWIPVGEPVKLMLETEDVIHSFWIPRLHGKADLLPAQQHVLWLRADAPGVYPGQCAEFCGLQHARMALVVEAVPRPDFDAWLEAQRAPARAPADATGQRGYQAFLANGCPLCHTVRGLQASGRMGPDLTHLASRRSLAAGTLPNTVGALAGWIAAPQSVKPGSHMPDLTVRGEDLLPLVAFLRGLE